MIGMLKRKKWRNFRKKKGIKIFECSAKTGDGVENAFKYMVETLIKKNDKTSKEKNNGNNSKLKTNEEKNKNVTKKKCCSSD